MRRGHRDRQAASIRISAAIEEEEFIFAASTMRSNLIQCVKVELGSHGDWGRGRAHTGLAFHLERQR